MDYVIRPGSALPMKAGFLRSKTRQSPLNAIRSDNSALRNSMITVRASRHRMIQVVHLMFLMKEQLEILRLSIKILGCIFDNRYVDI